MRMRRQMSEGRPGGNVRKKKKDNLNNRMALVGVTMVVLSLAVAVHIKGIDLKEKDRSYSIREENLEAQVAKEEERAKQLEEYRVCLLYTSLDFYETTSVVSFFFMRLKEQILS